MKRNKISLKWKLFAYILVFAMAIVFLFAFFQIFLLDDFYRRTKTKDINNLTNEVYDSIYEVVESQNQSLVDIINTDFDLTQKLVNISREQEASIYIFSLIGDKKYALNYYSSQGGAYSKFCVSGTTTTNDSVIDDIWKKALQSPKSKIFYVIFTENTDEKFQVMVTPDSKNQEEDALICGRFIESANQTYMIVIDSRLTPVGPAVETMKTQIFYISLIIVALTIVVAMLLSRTISKPIVAINETAKKMAKGDLNVGFTGHGYSEITDLNDTLNYTVQELKKTETLQRELLANVSHDLKTPLTLIGGYAEMMRDIPSENTPENAQIIIDETKRLGGLVNDLLSLSRIKARTEPLNIVEFSITDVLEEIVNRQNKLLETSKIKINLYFNEKVTVNADIHKISQVIYNFFNNAINYSGNATIVDVIQEVKDDCVWIKVRDYGIGIKPENIEYIWKRYYRVDKGLQRSTQGSGLGLSIIKEILEYHGFEYGVETQVNKGSTFYFIMPIVKIEK